MNGVTGKTLLAVEFGDLVRKGSTKSTVGVDDVALNADRETLAKGRLSLVDKLVVQTNVELVVLLAHLVGGSTRTHLMGRLEQRAKVKLGRLGVEQSLVDAEKVGTANHLVDGTDTKLGHNRSELLRKVVEEVYDMLWLSRELLTQFRILRSDTHWTRIEMAARYRTIEEAKNQCLSRKNDDE